jgi:predicted transcriptional regulator
MEQPLVVWSNSKYEVLGPEVTSAGKELIDYVLTKGAVLASEVAADLDITVQNASTRLKKLVDQGYILRTEEVAETGGIEYVYLAIK